MHQNANQLVWSSHIPRGIFVDVIKFNLILIILPSTVVSDRTCQADIISTKLIFVTVNSRKRLVSG